MIESAPAASGSGLEVAITSDGVCVVLAVSGPVDMQTAPVLTHHIAAALDGRPRSLIIDLSDVDFLASAGLESLLLARRRGGDTTVVVVADGPATSRPIRLTGVHEAISLYATREAAVEALNG